MVCFPSRSLPVCNRIPPRSSSCRPLCASGYFLFALPSTCGGFFERAIAAALPVISGLHSLLLKWTYSGIVLTTAAMSLVTFSATCFSTKLLKYSLRANAIWVSYETTLQQRTRKGCPRLRCQHKS